MRIETQDGTEIGYDRCLLASAGRPREFYMVDSGRAASYGAEGRVNSLLTLQDFEKLERFVEARPRAHVTVVARPPTFHNTA